jgi:hypothetical protein
MTMQAKEKELVLAAARVARRAPEEWKLFMAVFGLYANEQQTQCVRSTLDVLPTMQGRAQTSMYLNDLLANCVKAADSMKG